MHRNKYFLSLEVRLRVYKRVKVITETLITVEYFTVLALCSPERVWLIPRFDVLHNSICPKFSLAFTWSVIVFFRFFYCAFGMM